MLPRPDPPQVFVAAVVLVVLAFYGAVVLLRRRRFRTLGERLGAKWIPKGAFSPGTVAGRDFTIEARVRGGGGRSFYTNVRVSVPGAPGSFVLRTEFFESFPDWRFAKTRGTRTAGASGVALSVAPYSDADPEERRALSEWLSRGGAANARTVHQTLKALRIRELWVDLGSIEVSVPGVVSDFDRLHRTIALLRGLGAPAG